MPGLNHQIIYRKNEKLINEEWKNIEFNPLSNNGIKIAEEDYVEIHDDIIRWFFDIFNWIEMYNPSKKEQTNGFCYWGVTVIKNENIDKVNKIINTLIDLFIFSPSEIILTGDYCISDQCYEKVNISKDQMMKILTKIKKLTERVIENGGYLLHCGI